MKKKILLLAPDFPPEKGGIQNVLYTMAKSLNLETIAPHYKGDKEFDVRQNFKIYRVPSFLGNKKTSIPFMFIKTLASNHSILICGHIFTAIIGIILSKPYIIYTYGMEIFTTKNKPLFKWLLKKAYKVITISDFTANHLKKLGVKGKNIIKIYPTIDTTEFNPHINPSSIIKRYNLYNKKIILTVGRMAKNERYKGHYTIIKILPEIIKKIPDIKWVVVGTGDDWDKIKDEVSQSGLSDYVIFTGAITQDNLPALYKASNVFVMPSEEKKDKKGIKAEGFGIVYVEANACGIPVIAYKAGGAKEAVKDGFSGILLNIGDIEGLKNEIIKLLLDKNLADKLGMQGYQRVLKEFNANLLITQLKNIF